jgi:hypothetical protein
VPHLVIVHELASVGRDDAFLPNGEKRVAFASSGLAAIACST